MSFANFLQNQTIVFFTTKFREKSRESSSVVNLVAHQSIAN